MPLDTKYSNLFEGTLDQQIQISKILQEKYDKIKQVLREKNIPLLGLGDREMKESSTSLASDSCNCNIISCYLRNRFDLI